jgi:hypothetical protein
VDSVPHPTGYWVDADDVEPLVAEINRLRAMLAKAAEIVAYMNVDDLTSNYDQVDDLRGALYDLRDVLKG